MCIYLCSLLCVCYDRHQPIYDDRQLTTGPGPPDQRGDAFHHRVGHECLWTDPGSRPGYYEAPGMARGQFGLDVTRSGHRGPYYTPSSAVRASSLAAVGCGPSFLLSTFQSSLCPRQTPPPRSTFDPALDNRDPN